MEAIVLHALNTVRFVLQTALIADHAQLRVSINLSTMSLIFLAIHNVLLATIPIVLTISVIFVTFAVNLVSSTQQIVKFAQQALI